MSELRKRGVEVRDVTEANKRKLLAGTARGGSKPGATLGSSQVPLHLLLGSRRRSSARRSSRQRHDGAQPS